eukprot:COSAG01_NODE_21909_length_879_cov_58.276923_1_plen_179_part_01
MASPHQRSLVKGWLSGLDDIGASFLQLDPAAAGYVTSEQLAAGGGLPTDLCLAVLSMARPDPSGLVCMGDFAQLAHVQQEVNRLREDLQRGNHDGGVVVYQDVAASSPISDWKQRQLQLEDMPLLDEMSAAVELGDTGAVYSLLQRGAPVDAMNESGVTALMIAAYIGSLEMLQLILQF